MQRREELLCIIPPNTLYFNFCMRLENPQPSLQLKNIFGLAV